MTRRLLWVASLAWALSITACAHEADVAEPHDVREIIDAAQTAYDSQGLTSTAFVPGRRLVPVQASVLSPGVEVFQVLVRETQLAKAPCRGCHTVSVAELRRRHPANQAAAHGAVTLQHAPDDVMACATCHAGDDPGQLRLLGGAGIAIDHAYQVCAQCHSTQATDWVGGAHGKRVGGWAPPRISANCTECHNPHRPAFASRWPAHVGRTP